LAYQEEDTKLNVPCILPKNFIKHLVIQVFADATW